jgi:uncharacterized protein (TIGR02453 family)
MAFTGFPHQTFEFLSQLAANNSKEWFEAHRSDYEAYYVAPAKLFVGAMAPKLKAISKTVNCEPKLNGSIFRINRDVRFSKDKRPYKTHLDFWFWEGLKRGWESPGFFLRLTTTTMLAGAGLHSFSPEQLERYRAAVIDSKAGGELERIIAKIGPASLGSPERKTVPRGFDADHSRAKLLLHEGLHAFEERALPKSVHAAGFVEECVAAFRSAAPISRWLLSHVAKVA